MKLKNILIMVATGVGLSTWGEASIVYNEAVAGDLSNDGLSPTSVAVEIGSNQILGTTGRGASGIDRDYLTITVPQNAVLSSITVLSGTTSGGAVSFIGLEAGNQVTLSTNPADASGLLGWWHYSPSDIGSNILPEMAVPAMGSSGFTVLGSGQYSFWIQDFNSGTFSYGFDLGISGSPVPEPAYFTGVLIGCMYFRLRSCRSLRV